MSKPAGNPAQNSATSAIKPRGRPFRKGQSGNAGGRPKLPEDVKTAAREHTMKAIDTLVAVMNGRGANTASARVTAARVILDRGWGTPLQTTEITGKDGGPIQQETVDPRPKVSPEEWLKAHGVDLGAIAAGLGPAARAVAALRGAPKA